jgi:putative chitinase
MKFDRSVFFARYRAVFGKLAQSQVDGLNQMLDFAEKDADFNSVRWLAYALATVQRETGISGMLDGKRVPLTFNPITELGKRSYFDRYEGRKTLGNNQKGDGFLFRGRGYVQITGRRNYTEFEKLTGEKLVSNPDLALTPKVAWEILSTGMREGIFVPGQTLERYIPSNDKQKADYFTARKIINPGEIKSKPKVVKEMADNAVRWEALLRAAFVKDAAPVAVTVPTGKAAETKPDEPSENPFDMISGTFNGIYFPADSNMATAQGQIGGESQAFYVAVFQKGAKITIEITSEGNGASFSVSNQALEGVDFGVDSNDGKTWVGEIPESNLYYISVVGHSDQPDAPSAFGYTLTVTKG